MWVHFSLVDMCAFSHATYVVAMAFAAVHCFAVRCLWNRRNRKTFPKKTTKIRKRTKTNFPYTGVRLFSGLKAYVVFTCTKEELAEYLIQRTGERVPWRHLLLIRTFASLSSTLPLPWAVFFERNGLTWSRDFFDLPWLVFLTRLSSLSLVQETDSVWFRALFYLNSESFGLKGVPRHQLIFPL